MEIAVAILTGLGIAAFTQRMTLTLGNDTKSTNVPAALLAAGIALVGNSFY
ncbi:predicted protein [Sclerotinia sclerotiorum 1980 UF-70]|uniref:Uncharacterized protein n=1 Tax=Sclerotinia sclerotiorum (strain ATCC 18683 / 1980 / Ss-1) TaxID=665079 RepID=A7F5N1_SCLS1|nr:predicted protein [Sclerotinia sclerotiorum 1980 UF-70]EDN98052.1 predicted protein [Sclerotinia sclerotiorum 1980 UF-70]